MFFVFSLLVDAAWAIVIAWKTWFSPDYERLAPWEHNLHITTVAMVGANAVLKVGLAGSFDYSVVLVR